VQIAPSQIGFVGASFSLVAIVAASASPIPLYELYRRTDRLSDADAPSLTDLPGECRDHRLA
jgi:hypothetical protein